MNSTAIGLIVDGLDGGADILKFGFHYTVAGFEIYFGEMLLATSILFLFALLNFWGVKKAGVIQTILSGLLVLSVAILVIGALVSGKAQGVNMAPIWGFDKTALLAEEATAEDVELFAHSGAAGIVSAILATFAIAPWAYVGFDTIPQAAEEFKFSYKKVIGIMIIAILFGCFVYVANNTVAAAALENWPERVLAGEWVLLVAAEEMLGGFGKILIGIAVSSAVLSGIMGFYLASSRLMYSMAKDGYLPNMFGKVNGKYGTPGNAIAFCLLISLSGPVLGREALGWFVDMSAIGASMGFFFTSASALKRMFKDKDGNLFLKIMAFCGILFSLLFLILQLVPIPGLSGVHFGKESYLMLVVWIVLGFFFYLIRKTKNKHIIQ
jgi:amino acid transporter